MSSSEDDLDEILREVQSGAITPQTAKERLTDFRNLGFARLDTGRARRKGFSEVVFAEGKSPQQVLEIVAQLCSSESRVLATRVPPETAAAVLAEWPSMQHNEAARTLLWLRDGEPRTRYEGYVAVVSGGTSDIPVAEEAAVTAEALGAEVRRVYDVGVAGIHRLLANIDVVRGATAAIVVAGMEGALGSVVAGLVACPIVAVPTSVGYGANLGGVAALLTMLNSCAPGISVVNIDNGFGAGYFAALVCRQATEGARPGAAQEGKAHA